jgi:hypothetical protein
VSLLICLQSFTPAYSDPVTFTGLVVNTCVINITTPGVLGLATSGTTLSSEEIGGANALLAVVATGSAPQLQFSQPQLTGPAASLSGATQMMAYTSPGGAAQIYTSSASTYTMTRLIDAFTVKAKAANVSGFASGTYSVSSTVTCQQ